MNLVHATLPNRRSRSVWVAAASAVARHHPQRCAGRRAGTDGTDGAECAYALDGPAEAHVRALGERAHAILQGMGKRAPADGQLMTLHTTRSHVAQSASSITHAWSPASATPYISFLEVFRLRQVV